MANRTQKITLLNDRGIMGDNNPRLPDPSKIDYGQLAINYSKSKETLAIKNDNDEIVQFKDIKYIESVINNTVGTIQGGETDSIKTVVTDKVITSDLKLSSAIDNMVVVNPDGVYVTLDLTYNQGELVISGSNGLKKSVNLPLESFLADGQYYESYTYNGVVYKQVIVLTVRNEAGEEHPIIIPAGSLVNVYTFYGDSKGLVVTVTPSGSGDSNDYDVRITLKINPSSSNILVNDVNGLYVEDFRPYIAKAKQEAIDTAHQDAVNMDNIVIKHCETFATQEAQDAYDRATQFFLEWSNQVLHITGGTMLGPIVFVNSGSTVGGTIYHDGTINQFLSGSTTEYNSGSTIHIKEGTNVILDCGAEIEWCGEVIDKDMIDAFKDMMPKSGGTFYGPVIFGEKNVEGTVKKSSITFNSGTSININSGVTINGLIRDDDKILSEDGTSGIFSTLTIVSEDGKIKLKGINDVLISEIWQAPEIHLKSIELVSAATQSDVTADTGNTVTLGFPCLKLVITTFEQNVTTDRTVYVGLENLKSKFMLTDGTNCLVDLPLPTPTLTRTWTIYKADGVTVTGTSTASTCPEQEMGFVVKWEGSYKWSGNSTNKFPTKVTSTDNLFTAITANNVSSPTATKSNIVGTGSTSTTRITVTIAANKVGLIVQGDKVIPATGEDTTSASDSVTFKGRIYYGNTTQGSGATTESELKSKTNELKPSRANTITISTAPTVSEYFVYAYPKVMGALTQAILNGATPVLAAFNQSELTITNAAGTSITLYVYTSTQKGVYQGNDKIVFS